MELELKDLFRFYSGYIQNMLLLEHRNNQILRGQGTLLLIKERESWDLLLFPVNHLGRVELSVPSLEVPLFPTTKLSVKGNLKKGVSSRHNWAIPIYVHFSIKSILLWISLTLHMLLEHWPTALNNSLVWVFAKKFERECYNILFSNVELFLLTNAVDNFDGVFLEIERHKCTWR